MLDRKILAIIFGFSFLLFLAFPRGVQAQGCDNLNLNNGLNGWELNLFAPSCQPNIYQYITPQSISNQGLFNYLNVFFQKTGIPFHNNIPNNSDNFIIVGSDCSIETDNMYSSAEYTIIPDLDDCTVKMRVASAATWFESRINRCEINYARVSILVDGLEIPFPKESLTSPYSYNFSPEALNLTFTGSTGNTYCGDANYYYYSPWTSLIINLSEFVGREVTIKLSTAAFGKRNEAVMFASLECLNLCEEIEPRCEAITLGRAEKYRASFWYKSDAPYDVNVGSFRLQQFDKEEQLFRSPSTSKRLNGTNGNWEYAQYEFTASPTDKYIDPDFIFQNLSDEELLIDDVRIVPENATVQSFLYDTDKNVISGILDQNNMGLFYSYDLRKNVTSIKKENEFREFTIKDARKVLNKK